jgi:hypothetical protein
LTIYDINGKVLQLFDIEGVMGDNQVLINASQLGISGVLYYQLDCDTYSSTKKMIVTGL